MTASKIVLYSGSHAVLKNMVLRVKDVPMFYLPALYYPTKHQDRATGFLLPNYGTSSLKGMTLSNAFFWAVDRSQDVTIYHEKPEDGRLFTYPRYVIKGGEIVVEDGDVRAVTAGREFVVHPVCDDQIEDYLRQVFPKVYTISFENYPVEIERLRNAEVRPCI